MKKMFFVFWAVTFITVLGFFFYLHPMLPNPTASHFDMQGKPNGWTTPGMFTGILAFALCVTNFLNGGIAIFLEKIPANLLNIPDRDTWFSTPELKKEAFRRTRFFLALVSIYVNFLLLYVFFGVVRFNIANQTSFDGSFLALVLFSSSSLIGFALWYLRPSNQIVSPS